MGTDEMESRRKGGYAGVVIAVISALFLVGWFGYWQFRNRGLTAVGDLASSLPISTVTRNETQAFALLADSVLRTDGRDRTYLILFQNSLELRPGGGFIGSFGILKVKDGHVTEFTTHDTGNFDGRIPDTVTPPYPMKETLKIASWKLRDSNWEPDFPTNARKAVEFYEMGGGGEKFDGVVGITTDVLSSFLSVTGPVEVPGFPGTYAADNAVVDLERQVEQSYAEQGIDFGERKSVLALLGREIIAKVKSLPAGDRLRLFGVLRDDLNRKDIQLYFSDETLENAVISSGWDGGFEGNRSDDFLMMVDANLGAWKTDSVIRRSASYVVDLSRETPRATLSVTYEHTGNEKTFMVKDYQSYLRVYVPSGSHFDTVTGGATDPVYGEFMGKKYVGTIVQVPIGQKRTVQFEYDLPADLEREYYDLMIQRQAGAGDAPIAITVIGKDGSKIERNATLDRDFVLSEAGG
ncbi:MAG: DUF4012 domain-containing protein [Candidatus Moranbacteria bacterium]|nr:DUF4012 domain-containing protein [Candidatus Moranbacteria bacterium]